MMNLLDPIKDAHNNGAINYADSVLFETTDNTQRDLRSFPAAISLSSVRQRRSNHCVGVLQESWWSRGEYTPEDCVNQIE